jgi:hypothetical protein
MLKRLTWLIHANLTPLLSKQQQDVWVNEFHYDNIGTDIGEFVELGHTISLGNVRLFYQGIPTAGASTIPTITQIDLTGLVPSSIVNGISYTVVSLPIEGGLTDFSNDPRGFLISVDGGIGPTLSYEGPLVSEFVVSIDVGVSEDETTPIGYSLQKCPESNLWVGPLPNTKGGPNKKCNSPSPSSEPSHKPSFSPTETPSFAPSKEPSISPSASPTRLCPFQWYIYHSRSNKKVSTIVDGGTISNPPPCRFINIEAVPLCHIDPNDSVTIELYQGTTLIERRTDLSPKYFLFGNNGSDVFDGSIPAGTYSIRAVVNGGVSPSTTFTLGGKCGK